MARTRLNPRTAKVMLYQGDDMQALSDLKRAADHAKAAHEEASERLKDVRGADDELIPLAEAKVAAEQAFDAFVDQAAERAVEVAIQAIGPKRWQDLVLAHPPRMVPETVEAERALGETEPQVVPTGKMVEHDDDLMDGVNTATFPRALLMYTDGRLQTIASPEFEDEADRAAFVDDELAEGDFDRLWRLAFALNTARGQDPKGLRFDQRSDESTT